MQLISFVLRQHLLCQSFLLIAMTDTPIINQLYLYQTSQSFIRMQALHYLKTLDFLANASLVSKLLQGLLLHLHYPIIGN